MSQYQCPFCQQYTLFLKIEDLTQLGMFVRWCFYCEAEFLYWQDSSLASTAFYRVVNHKMYKWSCSNAGLHRVWYVEGDDPPFIPGTPDFKGELIKEFSSDHPITPINVTKKIKNLLTFL